MDIDSELFNRINSLARNEGIDLIQEILSDHQNGDFGVVLNVDTILDIGSGSGNVTQRLSDAVVHKKIVGVDVDEKMIEFAKKNHPGKAGEIIYMKEDMCLNFGNLSPEVQSYEGKIDLIYSNYVLHWLKVKDEMYGSINRFLNPDTGIMYATVVIFRQLWDPADDQGLGKYFKNSTPEEQIANWTSKFENLGMVVDARFEVRPHECESPLEAKVLCNIFVNMYLVNTAKIEDPELSEEVHGKIRALVTESYFGKGARFDDANLENSPRKTSLDVLRIKACKNTNESAKNIILKK